MTPMFFSSDVAKLVDSAPLLQTTDSGIPVRILLNKLSEMNPDVPLDQQFRALRKEIAARYLKGFLDLRKVQLTANGHQFSLVRLEELESVLSDPVIWISSSPETPRPELVLSNLPIDRRPSPPSWKAALRMLGIVALAFVGCSAVGIGIVALLYTLQVYWQPPRGDVLRWQFLLGGL